jgi:hypothetical protein
MGLIFISGEGNLLLFRQVHFLIFDQTFLIRSNSKFSNVQVANRAALICLFIYEEFTH